MLKIIVVAMLLAAGPAVAGTVYTDSHGREWLNVRNTVGYSWFDIASRCDVVTGICSGVLESKLSYLEDTDLEGMYWASREDVKSLFYDFGLPPGSLDDDHAQVSSTEGLGVAFYEHFQSLAGGITWSTGGYTRTLDYSADRGFFNYAAFVDAYPGFYEHPLPSCCVDRFSFSPSSFGLADLQFGSWMYRVHPVPEPVGMVLFCIGLLGLAAARRSRPLGARRDGQSHVPQLAGPLDRGS